MDWLTYDKLDSFEKGVTDHLMSGLHYTAEDALLLTNEYLPVLRTVSRHYNCEDYAEKLHGAKTNGLSPTEWLARIRTLRNDRVEDEVAESYAERKTKLRRPSVQ